jgi:hypothetical protein
MQQKNRKSLKINPESKRFIQVFNCKQGLQAITADFDKAVSCRTGGAACSKPRAIATDSECNPITLCTEERRGEERRGETIAGTNPRGLHHALTVGDNDRNSQNPKTANSPTTWRRSGRQPATGEDRNRQPTQPATADTDDRTDRRSPAAVKPQGDRDNNTG